MRKVVLYRRSTRSFKEDDEEIQALEEAGFTYLPYRTQLQKGDFVIPRYSLWPHGRELIEEIKYVGATPLNQFNQIQYVQDLQNWVVDLQEMTPETWDDLLKIPEEGPFVLKGGENSRKSHWKTKMYAENKQEAIKIYCDLASDSLIQHQKIYIRRYVPLFKLTDGVNGMPVTKEFRFFIMNQTILASSFYWQGYTDYLEEDVPSPEDVAIEFLEEAMRRIAQNPTAPTAYVMDVAIQADENPIVIELNSFEQAGLSGVDPKILYNNLQLAYLDWVSERKHICG